MIYRPFGNTGITASAVGLGTWNIGNQWGDVDEGTAYATVRAAFDAGVTLYDTAESYGAPQGLSEERLRRALQGIRHNVSVVSKIGNWGKRSGQHIDLKTKEMFILCCQASLFRLRTDYLDVYLCHIPDVSDDGADIFLDSFEELKSRGLIRYYGVSTDSLDVLKRFNKRGACRAVEIDYSLLNRSAEENGMLDYAKENGIGVLIRGPLAMGLLSGKYNRDSVFTDSVRSGWNAGGAGRADFERRMDSLEKIKKALPNEDLVEASIRYSFSHPANPVSIPGAKSAPQASENARAGKRAYGEQELSDIAGKI